MEKNPYLKDAAKMLKKQKLYAKFLDDNLLEISMDEENKTFAYLVVEREQFPGIILSLALDFHETYVVADIVINLMHIAPVMLGEAFYRSKNGNLYWSEAAQEYFMLEFDSLLLQDIQPVNKELH